LDTANGDTFEINNPYEKYSSLRLIVGVIVLLVVSSSNNNRGHLLDLKSARTIPLGVLVLIGEGLARAGGFTALYLGHIPLQGMK